MAAVGAGGSGPGGEAGGGGSGVVVVPLPPAPSGPDPNDLSDADLTCKGTDVPATPARLWRLNDAEWVATVHYAIRGARPANPTESFSPPRELAGAPFTYRSSDLFTTFADGYAMSQGDFEDAAAGATVAAQLMVTALKPGSPCLGGAATGTALASCLTPLVAARGELLFRRPLTSDEVARYVDVAVANLGKVEGGGEGAARLAFEAMLIAPQFLFRVETGTRSGADANRLTAYELASALSYSLTRKPPDVALWDAAKSNQLGTPEQIRSQVERLMTALLAKLPGEDYERGRHGDYPMLQMLRELFKYDNQPAKGPDLESYQALRAIFDVTETIKLVFKNNSRRDFWKTLLTTRTFAVRGNSAGYYAPTVKAQLRPHPEVNAMHNQLATFSASDRAGILSMPAFLSAWSAFDHNLPVQRGKFVREALLCRSVPPIPIAQVPPLPKMDRLRDALKVHSSLACAAGCHSLMDPLGLPFEQYDHVGYQRGLGGGHYTVCCGRKGVVAEPGPVDMSGAIVGSGDVDGPITKGVPELVDRLAQSKRVEQCFVRQNFRFWLGRGETKNDACAIKAAQEAYAKDGDLVALVATLLSSSANLVRSTK